MPVSSSFKDRRKRPVKGKIPAMIFLEKFLLKQTMIIFEKPEKKIVSDPRDIGVSERGDEVSNSAIAKYRLVLLSFIYLFVLIRA